MLSTNRKISYKSLSVLLYLVSLVALLALLVKETRVERAPFALISPSASVGSESLVLSLSGNNLHAEINALSTEALGADRGVAWRQMVDVPASAVAVKDDLLLVATHLEGKKIVSIGLDKDGQPRLLGSIQMPHKVTHIEIVGQRALVGMQLYAGYAVIDIGEPEDLKVVSHGTGSGLMPSMVAVGQTVYFADMYKGVGRIDLSVEEPTLEVLSKVTSPWRIARHGNKLAVGTLEGKVYLYDIMEDGRLHEVGEAAYATHVRGVAFAEDALVVVLADKSVEVNTLSLWPELESVAQLRLPGSPLGLESVSGKNSVAVNLIAGGVLLLDVSRPEKTFVSGHHRVPRTFRGVAVESGTIYGVSVKGLVALSVDELEKSGSKVRQEAPTLTERFFHLQCWNGQVCGAEEGSVVALSQALQVEGAKQPYLVAVGKNRVELYEQQEDGAFKVAFDPIVVAGAAAANFHNEFLVVLHREGLKVFGNKREGEFNLAGELALPGEPRNFELLDSGLALIATRNEGLLIVDIQNPSRPKLVSSIIPPSHLHAVNAAYDVVADEKKAYVSYGIGGVLVVDISNPEKPALEKIIRTGEIAKKMIKVDGLLIVADGTEGLFVIDTRGPTGARPVGNIQTPVRADDLALGRDGVIVSSHSSGTLKLPVPKRLHNVQVVSEQEFQVGLEGDAASQYVYLYDEQVSSVVSVTVQ